MFTEKRERFSAKKLEYDVGVHLTCSNIFDERILRVFDIFFNIVILLPIDERINSYMALVLDIQIFDFVSNISNLRSL